MKSIRLSKNGRQANGQKTRHRLKVHKEDFKQWAEVHYPSKKRRQQIVDQELGQISARRKDIDLNKEHMRKLSGDLKP